MPYQHSQQELITLVDQVSAITGKTVWSIWERLYSAFETDTNCAWRDNAKKVCQTTLEYLDEQGQMSNLLTYAQGFFANEMKKRGEKA